MQNEKQTSGPRASAAFAAKMTPAELRRLRARFQPAFDALREVVERWGDDLAAQHFPRPQSIDDWQHLARIVEFPFEAIRAEDWTAGEVGEFALAWADRQRIAARLRADVAAPAVAAAPAVPAADEPPAEQTPALTKVEQSTLRTLAIFDASILASLRQIVEEAVADEPLSDRAIAPAVCKLIKLGLAERPEGERQGVRLTLKGRRLAAKIVN